MKTTSQVESDQAPLDAIRKYCEGTLRTCEDALAKLGRPRDAWRVLDIVWNGGPRPGWCYGWDARETLGWPDSQVAEQAQSVKLTALRELTARTRAIARTEHVTTDEARRRAIQRDPDLYAQHLRQLQKYGAIMKQRAAWRHAEVATLMAATLERLHDPLATFAAGIALGEYHQFNHQQARLAREVRKLKMAAGEIHRRRSGKGGAGGREKPKSPHQHLIDRTVCVLHKSGHRVTSESVRELLRIESRWRKLALDMDDPLYALVGVNVQDNGTVEFEYTGKWALSHGDKRFKSLNPKSLGAAITRAKGRLDKARHR